jgi:hypothetical protein
VDFIVHWGGCPWPKGECDCISRMGRWPKIREDEQDFTPEQFAENWNRRSREMGRTDDTWGVVDGQVVKTGWEGKGYSWKIVDNVVVRVKDEE